MDLGVNGAASGGGQFHVAGDVHLDVFDDGLPGLAWNGDELCLQLDLREVSSEYLGFSQMFLHKQMTFYRDKFMNIVTYIQI